MAIRHKIKKKAHEKLDNANISRVIKLLADTPPITKKAACEILNISYSTTRLARIIEEYEDRIAYTKRRRDANRGKPLSKDELHYLVTEYLRGEPIAGISNSLYRSSALLKNALINNKVPTRETGITYKNPALIPDENLKEEYKIGELIWSARYNCMAQIVRLSQITPEHGNTYQIWIFGKHNEYAHQPWYELGCLPVLEKLNITEKDISLTNEINFNYG